MAVYCTSPRFTQARGFEFQSLLRPGSILQESEPAQYPGRFNVGDDAPVQKSVNMTAAMVVMVVEDLAPGADAAVGGEDDRAFEVAA